MIRPSIVGVILRAELRAYRNRLLKRGAGRLAVLAVLLAGAVIFIGGGAFSLGLAVGRFLGVARDPILAGGFTTLSILMLVVGFPTVISSFFVGRDLLQIVIAPVRPVEIFVARAVLAMSANALISGILLAAVLGIGAGSQAPPAYYPLAVILVINQVLIVSAIQALLMSIILRWIPARRARDVAAAIAGLTGAGFYFVWNISLRQSFSARNGADLTSLTSFAQHIDALPSAWPGHALSAAIDGDVAAVATWTLLALAFSAVVVAAAQQLYGRTLLAGLGVFGSAPSLWSRGTPRRARVERQGAGSPLRAIARKDWLGYRRDIRRLSRLVPALLFPVGYAIAFLRPTTRGLSGFWTEVFLIAFVSMFMSSALGTPSIPSERRGFQLMRMAPLPMWQLIRAKVLLTLPPVIVLTMLFSVVVAIATNGGVGQAATVILVAAWLGAGFVSIDVAAGGIDPNFESTDDRRSVGLFGTLTGLGASVGFGLLSLGALALGRLAGDIAAGTAHLGPIPTTPVVGVLSIAVAVLLVAGAAAIVVVLVVIATARLNRFEAAINPVG